MVRTADAGSNADATIQFHELKEKIHEVLHAVLPALKHLAESLEQQSQKGAGLAGLAAQVAEAIDSRLAVALNAQA